MISDLSTHKVHKENVQETINKPQQFKQKQSHLEIHVNRSLVKKCTLFIPVNFILICTTVSTSAGISLDGENIL